jgi:hypothetical protein
MDLLAYSPGTNGFDNVSCRLNSLFLSSYVGSHKKPLLLFTEEASVRAAKNYKIPAMME